MRKFILSFLALTIAVSASAFSLKMKRRTLTKDIYENSTDVFSDGGSVAVTFDNAAQTVYVTLKDCKLYDFIDYEGCPFSFTGDATYKNLVIKIDGKVTIESCETSTEPAMDFSNCMVDIISASIEKDSLYVKCHHDESPAIYASDMNIGNRRNGSFFMGVESELACISCYRFNIYSVRMSLKCNNNDVPVYASQASLKYNQLSSYYYKFENGRFLRYRKSIDDWEEILGSFSIPAPYAIFFGEEPIFAENPEDFQPSSLITEYGKRGTISYDEDTKTLTLEDAIIDGDLWIGYDDFTLELKGGNYFRNTAESTTTRIEFAGKNAKIKGDDNAWLSVKGKSKCDGIHVAGGLELVGFNSLDVADAVYGIVGNKNATASENVLHSNAEMSLTATKKVLKDFSDFTYASGMICGTSFNEDHINLYYSTLFYFYDVKVTAKNAANIAVQDAEGKASYDKATATLKLENYKNDNTIPTNAILADDDMTIELVGTNKLDATSDVISTQYNLTIEGNGKLEASSTSGYGISLPATGVLTIKNGAEVDASGESGVYAAATLYCTGGGMGDPEEPSGDAATLTITNASLKASASQADVFNGAVWGFKTINITGAEMAGSAAPAFMCDGTDAYAGIMNGNAYAQSVTIAKTGGAAIDQINDIQAATKLLREGQLIIEHNGKTYNVMGAEVR